VGTSTAPSTRLYFGSFELDPHTGELWKSGRPVKLPPQPTKLLIFLAGRRGELVTREEIKESLWGADTFVDFEQGLNFCIKKIRFALGDNPDQPEFIQTLPRRGYRFIGPPRAEPPAVSSAVQAATAPRPRKTALLFGLVFLAVASITFALIFAFDVGNLRDRWFGGAGAHRIKSLAVLPLRNLSQDPEQEYFSDGMTDELITDLAKAGGLRVISHTSVEQYKDTKRPLPEIARELGVDAVVEGTVMRSGNRVRITAQLIDARSDHHLWADSYERDVRDVFGLQDEVAQRIAREVGTNLIAREPSHRPSKPVVDPAAYEAYLKGNFYWNQLSCDGFNKGRAYFEQAVAKDPNFAPAYVGLAESYFTLADWGCSQEAELIPKSRAAALKAVELDPNSGPAHAWLGKLAFFYEWNLPKAESELKLAIELDPNHVPSHVMYAVFLVTVGRQDDGLAEMRKAKELDPTSQLTNGIGVFVSYLARQYDQAIEQGNKTIELYPGSVLAYDWLGATYEKSGHYDQANAAYLKSKELQGASQKELAAYQSAYQKSGIRGYWQKELEAAEQSKSVDACWMSRVYAHLGKKEQMLEFLNRSSQQHCSGPHTVIADPINDPFRDDPRFKDVVARLRLSQR
jgi:TolB-like protein/DNA-binding winged helix-turn-helix (wHTH) protein/Tfp pilus assembly protein PilF